MYVLATSKGEQQSENNPNETFGDKTKINWQIKNYKLIVDRINSHTATTISPKGLSHETCK